MKIIIKRILKTTLLLSMSLLLFGSCRSSAKKAGYTQITPEEAKAIMDSGEKYLILDVRTQSEFDAGHIKGAVLIPDNEIAARAEAELPDKDALILVYCRSGRRSKNASKILADMGYTNVKEFGGIIDWPYGIEN